MRNANRRLVTAAMMAAMTVIATMVITIPTAGGGYVNIGDALVILSGWLLGGPYGALAAGIGSALADVLSGYAVYAPATFVIKALMGFIVGLHPKIFASMKNRMAAVIVVSAAAELIMLAGYFVFEALILGMGMAATASVAGNAVQAVVCLVLGNILIPLVSKINAVKNLMA